MSVGLDGYSNRISRTRYTQFIQYEGAPPCVSWLARSPHKRKLGKSSYGNRPIRQAIYNCPLEPILKNQTTPGLLQCRSWIAR